MGWRITVWMRSTFPILLLALSWGLIPALGPLFAGELLGHGYTDLFPSVWGLWAFAEAQPGLPNHTELLGFPGGMGYYFSSPIKGWIATLLLPWLGLTHTWNVLLIAARIATPLCAWGAARAWGLGTRGSTVAAVVYGCSPFFHGYAVEGIVEGTDGWTLALWLWALGSGRFRLAWLPFALTILSSWYLGMVACLLWLMTVLWDRRSLWSGLGLVAVLPALYQFGTAFPGTAPLEDAIRASMGASITIPTPGIHTGLHPFAINTYVGFVALSAALASRTRWVLIAAIPAFLSFGVGPIYSLPIAELVRFPYRWHAATLVLLAPAIAITANRVRWGQWLAPLIVLEGLLLSPVEPLIPGASAEVPAYTAAITGPVLDLPGPLAMPPGQVNPSRSRANYLMFHQTMHGQPSPWIPDFNSVGVAPTATSNIMKAFEQIDPLTRAPIPTDLPIQQLNELGVQTIVLHPRKLGRTRSQSAITILQNAGCTQHLKEKAVIIYRCPSPQ